jgi:hypothetical protein
MTQSVRILNKGTDEIQDMTRDMKKPRLDNYTNKEVKTKEEVPPKKKYQEPMSGHMSHHLVPLKHKKTRHMPRHAAQQKKHMSDIMSHHYVPHVRDHNTPVKRCDYCRKSNHLMAQCFKLYVFPQRPRSPRQDKKESQAREVSKSKDAQNAKVWKTKVPNTGQRNHTLPRMSSKVDWYFDNGCSKHMTGEKKILRGSKTSLYRSGHFW